MVLPMVVVAAVLAGADAAPPAPMPQAGSISIEVTGDDAAGSHDAIVRAVGAALADRNFVLLPGRARYRMRVDVGEERVGVAPVPVGKARASVGVAALAVPLPSRKTAIVDLVKTTLTLRMTAGDDPRPLWRASAITVRPRYAVAPGRLIAAAFASYPTSRAEPVSVP